MQIALLFLLASFATFGDCKKSHHAKSDGHLTHKKGHKKAHKKGATALKTNKSDRKSKAREVEPKIEGTDYIDMLATMGWEKREKHWMGKWEGQWNKLNSHAEKEMSKPKSEHGRDPNSQMEGWDILMDALRDTNVSKIEEQRVKNALRKYIRFFINPKHRRRGVKWSQTTTDTESVFLTHTISQYLQELIHTLEKREKKKKSCVETYSCSWTTRATTTTPAIQATRGTMTTPSSTTAGTQPPLTWPPLIKDNKERKFMNSFLHTELGRLSWKPRTEETKRDASHSDYGHDEPNELDKCSPETR